MTNIAISSVIAFVFTLATIAYYASSPSPLSTNSCIVVFAFWFLTTLGVVVLIRKRKMSERKSDNPK